MLNHHDRSTKEIGANKSTYERKETTMNDQLLEMQEQLRIGNTKRVTELTQALLDQRIAPQTILNDGLIAGMSIVGEHMRTGQMYLPEVLKSAGAMRAAMEILKPLLIKLAVDARGKIVLGTVKGDMHDIGKNLVGIMLQGAGMDVIDLGVNTPPEKFVEAIREHKPAIVGMSALLTTTMMAMKKTIETITASGVRPKIKIIVGGAAVSQNFANQIGADGYARDAVGAVDKVKELLAT